MEEIDYHEEEKEEIVWKKLQKLISSQSLQLWQGGEETKLDETRIGNDRQKTEEKDNLASSMKSSYVT